METLREPKVSFGEKLRYGLGDAGCNFVWTTVGSFLIMYYIDVVGIAAAMVGTIMLVARLVDGGLDLVFGVLIDKTKTRWGKARPWILWSAIPLAISLVLLFNVPSGWSIEAKVAYAFATYIFLAAFCYTPANLSYSTLLCLITNNQHERTVMSTIRFLCTMAAVLIISYITMPLVAQFGGGQSGWSAVSVIFAVLALGLLLVTFFGTKERYVPMASGHSAQGITVGQSFKLLMKNKHFVYTTIIFLVNYAAMGASMGVTIYYAKDILGDASVFGTLMMVGMVPVILGLFFYPMITKLMGKQMSLILGYGLMIIGLVLIAVFPTSLPIVLTGLVIKGIGSVPHTAGLFAIVADVVDYGEWKTNVRLDGLTNSAVSFGMRVGTGIGTALVGWVLAAGNYTAGAATQSGGALAAMLSLYIYIPLGLYVVGLVVMFFLNIDKQYAQITADLQKRREGPTTV